MYAGSIIDRAPINPSDYSIKEIIEGLKSKWTPESLREEYKRDEFNNPRNAEGLGNALREDIKKRIKFHAGRPR